LFSHGFTIVSIIIIVIMDVDCRIMREESQRYENVHHPESSNEPLKIYNYEQLPEFIVNWIILSVFPIASEINETHWGVPVMFKLMVCNNNK